jgi:RNA polymerase sigma factor (sigma-70 family)
MTPNFDELYAKYHTYVRAGVSKQIPASDRDDVEQSTWLAVFQCIQDSADVDNPKAWLANLIHAQCTEYRRHRETTVSLDQQVGDDPDTTVGATLEESGEPALDPVVQDEVRAAIDNLPPRTREVINLHYYAAQSIEQIALALGISAGTVKWHLSSGRNSLRGMLLGEVANKAA